MQLFFFSMDSANSSTSFAFAGVEEAAVVKSEFGMSDICLITSVGQLTQTNFDIHVHSLDNYLEATIHENPLALFACLLRARLSLYSRFCNRVVLCNDQAEIFYLNDSL